MEHDASPPRRAGAFLVDALLAGLFTGVALRLWLVAAAPPGRIVHLQDVRAWWVPPTALAVWVVYRALTESGGGSVGKRLFSVYVHHEAGRVGLVRAALRALTAPFDAVLGHLEREGPFDRRQKLRVVRRPRQGWQGWIFPGVWMALALACALWLGITPTSSLVRERRALAALNRCGEVPRDVIRFTDRSRDLSLTHRCDAVMRSLLARAAEGDAAARAELSPLPYAQGWRR